MKKHLIILLLLTAYNLCSASNFIECSNVTITCTNVYSLSGFLLQTFEGEICTLSHLPDGMYILQHRMSDGSTRIEKIANNK